MAVHWHLDHECIISPGERRLGVFLPPSKETGDDWPYWLRSSPTRVPVRFWRGGRWNLVKSSRVVASQRNDQDPIAQLTQKTVNQGCRHGTGTTEYGCRASNNMMVTKQCQTRTPRVVHVGCRSRAPSVVALMPSFRLSDSLFFQRDDH